MDFPSVHVPPSTDNIKFGNPLPNTTPSTIKVDQATFHCSREFSVFFTHWQIACILKSRDTD